VKIPYCTEDPTKIGSVTTMPSVCNKHPRKRGPCNVALGHGGGTAWPIPARPAALPAVQGCGDEGMLTKGSLVLGVWAGRHPTVAHDGDRR
jgi:hypothetical protein